MIGVITAAVMFALVKNAGEVCSTGEKTVELYKVILVGPDCPTPKSTFVQWWDKNLTPRSQLNAPVGDIVGPDPDLRSYEPGFVWFTSDFASSCDTGHTLMEGDQCYGLFKLRCASARYTLTVSTPGLKVNILRSVQREGKGRCDSWPRYKTETRYTDGEHVSVALFTMNDEFVCQTTLDLNALQGKKLITTFDTAKQEWSHEKDRPIAGRAKAANNDDYQRKKRPNVPKRVTIELTPVPPS